MQGVLHFGAEEGGVDDIAGQGVAGRVAEQALAVARFVAANFAGNQISLADEVGDELVGGFRTGRVASPVARFSARS